MHALCGAETKKHHVDSNQADTRASRGIFYAMGFKARLKSEMSYNDIILKELASSAGISVRTLESYVDSRERMPAADVAVRIAKALGTTVEYLVTGEDSRQADMAKYMPLRDVMDNLLCLSPAVLEPIKAMIHKAAEMEKERARG